MHTHMQISLTCMFQLSEGYICTDCWSDPFYSLMARTCSLHLHYINNALGYVNYPSLTKSNALTTGIHEDMINQWALHGVF